MVFFHHPDSNPPDSDDPLPDDARPSNRQEHALQTPQHAASSGHAPIPSSSCLIISRGHLSVRVDVSLRRPVGSPSTRLDVSVAHGLSTSSQEFDMGRIRPSVARVPVRSVSSLRSLFDIAGPAAACSTNYGQGREIGGKSSIVALQVPASSLPPPLTASAVADSVQIGSSGTCFPALANSERRLLDTMPSARGNIDCIRCQSSQSAVPSSPLTRSGGRGGVRGGGSCTNMEGTPGPPENSSARAEGDLVRRLSDVLHGRGDEDLVLRREDRQNVMLEWLEALDFHVLGACRADERLRPMLRWNGCSSDGRLLAHLSQHFKPRELGLLARCLCAPLVTVRVGKVRRQGRLLCPTTTRGYLSLTMLPCSEMRLSFVGDNDVVERIASVTPGSEHPPLVLEMLHADTSGRTLVLKLPCRREVYFWQSEKSKAAGDELLSKMKDILKWHPTLVQLTGIHESRLDSFVSHLRTAVLVRSTSTCFHQSSTLSSSSIGSTSTTENSPSMPSSSASTSMAAPLVRQSQRLCWNRVSPSRLPNSPSLLHARAHSGNQGSLSPRTSGFKDGTVKGAASVRSIILSRDRHKRRLDNSNSASCSSVYTGNKSGSSQSRADLSNVLKTSWSRNIALSAINEENTQVTHSAGLYISMQPASCTAGQHEFTFSGETSLSEQVFSLPVGSISCAATRSWFPSLIGGSPLNPSAFHTPAPSHMPISTASILAPYYCPCPLRASALEYTFTPPCLTSANVSSTLPPSSSLFSVRTTHSLISQTSLSLDRVTLSPIPLPVSSLVNLSTPLQSSSHPLLFSDPIVHIPVINFQSATQSYLVSAPPALSSSGISPVLPSFFSSILPHTEAHFEGDKMSAFNFLQSLDVLSWDNLEDQQKRVKGINISLSDNKCKGLLETHSEARIITAGVKQEGETSNYRRLEGSGSSSEAAISSFDLRCGGRAIASSYDNLVHYDRLPQHSGPSLGVVPAMLTSGSLSCVLNLCQDRVAKSTAWMSGSRGLYGGSCEPGIPAFAGSRSPLKASSMEMSTYWTQKGNPINSENVQVLLPFNARKSTEDEEVTEKVEEFSES